MAKFSDEQLASLRERMAAKKAQTAKPKTSALDSAAEVAGGINNTVEGAGRLVKSGIVGAANGTISPLNLLGINRMVGNKKPFKFETSGEQNPNAEMVGAMLNPLDPFSKLKVPGMVASKISPAIRALAKKVGMTPEGLAAKIAARTAEGAAKGSVGTAAMGETLGNQEEGSIPQNLMAGGLAGGALGAGAAGAIPALKGAFNAAPEIIKAPIRGGANAILKKLNKEYAEGPNLMRSPKEVEQIGKGLPENVRFNIGEIADNPGMKKFYTSIMRKIPWTNVPKYEREALSAAVGKTEDVRKALLGKTSEHDALETLRRNVSGLEKQKAKEASSDKYYGGVRKTANEKGILFRDIPNTSEAAKKHLREFEAMDTPLVGAQTKKIFERLSESYRKPGDSKIPSDANSQIMRDLMMKQSSGKTLTPIQKKIFNNLEKKYPGLDAGNAGNVKTFDQMRLDRKWFSDKSREAFDAGNKNLGKIMLDMKNQLGKDIEKTFKDYKQPEAYKKFKDSEKFYATDVAPLRHDVNMRKIIDGRMPAESIPNALYKSKKGQVFGMLPQKDKNLIAYDFMKGAMRNTEHGEKATPVAMKNQLERLRGHREEKLFKSAPELKELFNQQKTIAKATQEGASASAIHQTGKQAAELGTLWKLLTHPTQTAGAVVGGRQAAKLMNSPVLRKAYASEKKIEKGSALEKELMRDFTGPKTKKAAEKYKKATNKIIDFLNKLKSEKALKGAQKGIPYAITDNRKGEE